MIPSKLRTAIIGFGKIASGYARDLQMAKYMKYSTHAQVLADHPDFSLEIVVDPDEESLNDAKITWGVKQTVQSIGEAIDRDRIDVVIVATPPSQRKNIIDSFPNLRGVLFEKPLSSDFQSAVKLGRKIREKKLLAQVNLIRRADKRTREFAAERLVREIGIPQSVFGLYGNGLINNGTHLVDLSRMLFGEVEYVQSIGAEGAFREGPIDNDLNFPFTLKMQSGLLVSFQPVRFSNYRENGLVIWGDKGRLEYLHGGITLLKSKVAPNRMISNSNEVVVDDAEKIESTLGEAIYEMYSNLAAAIRNKVELFSPIDSALETERVVDSLLDSARNGDTKVIINASL